MTGTTRRELMALMTGAAAGVALGGEAFAQATPKRGGILRISAPANPSSLDPTTGGAGSDHAFLFTMYDTLTEWEFETLKPKLGLAESWKYADPTTFVMDIRAGGSVGTDNDAATAGVNEKTALFLMGESGDPALRGASVAVSARRDIELQSVSNPTIMASPSLIGTINVNLETGNTAPWWPHVVMLVALVARFWRRDAHPARA